MSVVVVVVCVCVCVCVRARARVCERLCAFVLYALNFENMCIKRTRKRLGPVRARQSKYPFLCLLIFYIFIRFRARRFTCSSQTQHTHDAPHTLTQ